MALTPKRIRLYRFISGVIVILIIIKVIGLVNRVRQIPGADDYTLNDSINRRNAEYAKGNSFGFTDRERVRTKPKGVFRIAVLGDSFIWGSGLPYEQIWSHKLESKLLAEYDSIEIMSWGLCGWSTLDEFNFYKEHGKDFDIDLLIIGWVDNDPDIGRWPLDKWVPHINPKKEYPRTSKIMLSLAQRWAIEDENKAYVAWTDSLYTKRNLAAYRDTMLSFYSYVMKKNIPTIYVLTPCNFDEGSSYLDIRQRYSMGESVIRSAGIPCYNLYEPSHRALGTHTSRELQANAVNAHPGVLMTEEFANEVKTYLEKNRYLASVPKRK